MKSLSTEELRELAQFSTMPVPCVSIYLPTHRHFPGTEQDPIRFKNLLRDAERRLIDVGLDATNVGEFLHSAQELLLNPLFWRHQSDGLAVFWAQGFFRYYRMPVRFPELLVVTHRFHLKPLLALLSRDRRFFILTLSQNQAKLFEASLEGASEITPNDFPKGLEAILQLYDPANELQSHTGIGNASGKRGSIFHGQSGIDDLKDRISEYFRQIDKSIVDTLAEQQSPLVLAGVDYLLPIYRKVNTYPQLVDNGIAGNPDSANPEELHQKAWTIVEPVFQTARKEAAERYQRLAATGRASRNLKEIVAAAHYGRVESLFVAVGVQCWGTFDPNSGAVATSEAAGPNVEDLLDLAAVRTLLSRGSVFALDPTEMPEESPVTAVFRY